MTTDPTPTPPQPSAEAVELVEAFDDATYSNGLDNGAAGEYFLSETRAAASAALLAYIAGLEADLDRLASEEDERKERSRSRSW